MSTCVNIESKVINFEALYKKLEDLGIVKEKTIKRIEKLKADSKILLSDTIEVDDEGNESIVESSVFKKLFSSDENVRSEARTALKNNLRKDILAKLGMFVKKQASNSLHLLFTKEQLANMDSKELIANTIGITTILDALNSETNLYENNNLKEDTIALLNMDGNQTTDLQRLLPVIGRQVLEAQGVVLAGDAFTNIANYIKVGQTTIDNLVNLKIISTENNRDAIKGNSMVTEEGKWVESTTTKNLDNRDKMKLYKTNVVYINPEAKHLKNNAQRGKIFAALKQISRIINPTTEKVPTFFTAARANLFNLLDNPQYANVIDKINKKQNIDIVKEIENASTEAELTALVEKLVSVYDITLDQRTRNQESKNTKNGTINYSSSNTVIVTTQVDKDTVKVLKGQNEGFEAKDEFHITLVGFKEAKNILGPILANPENKVLFDELLKNADLSYTLTNKFYKLSKEYPEAKWTDANGNEQRTDAETRESVIQLVKAPGLTKLIDDINKTFNITLSKPVPHITLLTKGNKAGIGITSKEDLAQLDKKKIYLPVDPIEFITKLDNAVYNASNYDMALSPDLKIVGKDSKKFKKNLKKLFNKLQKNEFKISKNVVSFLRELKKIWDENEDNKSINSLFSTELGKNYSFLKDVLGIDNLTYKELELNQESSRGQEQSKVSPLVGLLENLDELTDEEVSIRFSMFIARNSRTHIANDIVNYQTDNFMSRHILEAKTDTIYADQESIVDFIQRVADESGFSVNEIIAEGINPNLDLLLKVLDEKEESQINIIEDLYYKFARFGMTGKFWKNYKYLQAIKDIRNGKKGIGETTGKPVIEEIRSSHLFEADATASGILIKFLLSLDFNPESPIYRLLDKMTKESIDSYSIGVDKFVNMLIKESVLDSSNNFKMVIKDLIGDIELDKLQDNTSDEYVMLRTLLKDAIMTFSYGQGPNNNAVQFAKTVIDKKFKTAEKITDVINIKLYKSIDEQFAKDIAEFEKLGDLETSLIKDITLGKTDEETLSNQRKLRRIIVETVSKNAGIKIVKDILKAEYSDRYFSNYDKQVEKLYEMFSSLANKEAGKDRNKLAKLLSVVSPVSSVFNDGIDANIMLQLTQLKETIINVPNSNATSILKQEHENPISAKVVPIHAMDSAILLQTVKEYYEEFLKQNFTPDQDSIMLIHDAVQGNAKAIKWISERYEQNLIKVAYNYDLRTELIKAIESLNGTVDSKLKSEVSESVKNKKLGMESLFKIDKDTGRPGVVLKHSFTTEFKNIYENHPSAELNSEDVRNMFNSNNRTVDTSTNTSNKIVQAEAEKIIRGLVNKDIDSKNSVYLDIEVRAWQDGVTAMPSDIYEIIAHTGGSNPKVIKILIETNFDKNRHAENPENMGLRSNKEIDELFENKNNDYVVLENIEDAIGYLTSLLPTGSLDLYTFNGDGFDLKLLQEAGLQSTTNREYTSYDMYKAIKTIRKVEGKGQNTQTTLAQLLNVEVDGKPYDPKRAHDADYDIQTLKAIVRKLKDYSEGISTIGQQLQEEFKFNEC